jgi:Fe2+ or Zn2+ uptake regulation protein
VSTDSSDQRRHRQLTVAQLSEQLRSRGLRVTGPRLIVYRTLAELGGHRSADDVSSAVAAAGPGLPRTSVYNALKALAEAGLVDVVDAGPGTALYEVHAAAHHHFICRSCNTLLDVHGDARIDSMLTTELPGALVESAQVVLRGLCAGCLADAAGSGQA